MADNLRAVKKRRAGQVVVELMLILPVFMIMVFFIMELGNIAFQTIVAHHAAYELARIGSLLAGRHVGSGSTDNVDVAKAKMKTVLESDMFPNPKYPISLDAASELTSSDPQVAATGGVHLNEDLVVTMKYPIRLFFPFSSYALSQPRGAGYRLTTVKVRMPIEKPIFQ